MYPPALMVKTMEPYTELIRFKALSDEDMLNANKRFEQNQEPYAIVRLGENSVAA